MCPLDSAMGLPYDAYADLVELVMAMEEEFDMGEAGEDELAGLKTVGDAVNFVASRLK